MNLQELVSPNTLRSWMLKIFSNPAGGVLVTQVFTAPSHSPACPCQMLKMLRSYYPRWLKHKNDHPRSDPRPIWDHLLVPECGHA